MCTVEADNLTLISVTLFAVRAQVHQECGRSQASQTMTPMQGRHILRDVHWQAPLQQDKDEAGGANGPGSKSACLH